MPDLANALEGILDAIGDDLDAARATGEPLAPVAAVVRADRARSRPAEPTVWVFTEPAQLEHQTFALAETWTLPVALAAVVRNPDKPESGYVEATRLAARARSVLLASQLEGIGYVADVTSGRFEASSPWHSDPAKGLHAALAVVVVRFTVREGD